MVFFKVIFDPDERSYSWTCVNKTNLSILKSIRIFGDLCQDGDLDSSKFISEMRGLNGGVYLCFWWIHRENEFLAYNPVTESWLKLEATVDFNALPSAQLVAFLNTIELSILNYCNEYGEKSPSKAEACKTKEK
jgi:hypothetical protein